MANKVCQLAKVLKPSALAGGSAELFLELSGSEKGVHSDSVFHINSLANREVNPIRAEKSNRVAMPLERRL